METRVIGGLLLALVLTLAPMPATAQTDVLGAVAGGVAGTMLGSTVAGGGAEDAVTYSALSSLGSVLGVEAGWSAAASRDRQSDRSPIQTQLVGIAVGSLAALFTHRTLNDGVDDRRVWIAFAVPHGIITALARR